MASLGDFLVRMSHYTISTFINMLAGLISYPILTRILSVEEYGIMGLNVLLFDLATAISKLGLQLSSIRLWPEWTAKENGRNIFIITMLSSTLMISLPVLLIFNTCIFASSHWVSQSIVYFTMIGSPLVFIRSFSSFGFNLLRAQERSKENATFEVATTYLAMIGAVVGATLVLRGLRGYYLGLITGELLVVLVLLPYVLRGTSFKRDLFSRTLFFEALTFGLPMALFELGGSFFFYGDRFVILGFLDEKALGYYTVARNLSAYIGHLMAMPVNTAGVPMYTNVYEREGAAATGEFLRKAVRFYFMFAFPAIVGVFLIRKDLLVLLASKQFLPAADLLPYHTGGILLFGSRILLGAGLFLKKRPWLMCGLNFAGAALNMLLASAFLFHSRSILSAAQAAFLGQAIMCVVISYIGSRQVLVRLDIWALLRHAACAIVMGVCVSWLPLESGAGRLAVIIPLGGLLYGLLLMAVDGQAREYAKKIASKLSGR